MSSGDWFDGWYQNFNPDVLGGAQVTISTYDPYVAESDGYAGESQWSMLAASGGSDYAQVGVLKTQAFGDNVVWFYSYYDPNNPGDTVTEQVFTTASVDYPTVGDSYQYSTLYNNWASGYISVEIDGSIPYYYWGDGYYQGVDPVDPDGDWVPTMAEADSEAWDNLSQMYGDIIDPVELEDSQYWYGGSWNALDGNGDALIGTQSQPFFAWNKLDDQDLDVFDVGCPLSRSVPKSGGDAE